VGQPAVAKAGKLSVGLRDHKEARIRFEPASGADRSLRAEVVLLGGDIESDVKRGENGGHRLQHDFVVLYHESLSMAADGTQVKGSLALPEKLGRAPVALAAWVTTGDSQPVLQATGGWIARR
jgi:hypothetical protein